MKVNELLDESWVNKALGAGMLGTVIASVTLAPYATINGEQYAKTTQHAMDKSADAKRTTITINGKPTAVKYGTIETTGRFNRTEQLKVYAVEE